MSPIRVLLNDRCAGPQPSGIGHYIAELARAMPAAAPEIAIWRPRAALWRAPSSAMGASQVRRGRPAWWRRAAAEALYAAALDVAGRLGRFDLYHEPNHIPGPWSGPIVTTVHDLSALRHPAWHPADRVRWYEEGFAAGLERTSRFIAISAFTRDEMVELLGIGTARITVVPLGVREVFRPWTADQLARLRAEQGLPGQYLLFVGTLEPRKNLRLVLEAYARLSHPRRAALPLLIAGGAGWGEDLATLVAGHGLGDDVRHLGYVDDGLLAGLYSGAAALVWPSLYEGFGLPPLECAACGTPAIISTAGALVETMGAAGIAVDPYDPAPLTAAIERLCDDEDWQACIRTAGLARAAEFTWEASAAAHADVYRAAL